MNFFFGQVGPPCAGDMNQSLRRWLEGTIFWNTQENLSIHHEADFGLVLINDPRGLFEPQSVKIHVEANFVCTSDGILYNRRDIAERLDICNQSSNEQLIIASYRKWGKLFPDKYEGKFSFVLWDRVNKKLLGGRDALGYGNLCYSQKNGVLYFASDLATLLDQPMVEKSVNRKRFFQCLHYANNPPEQTYFEHCRYCPPSHILEFSNTISVTDYWKLDRKVFAEPDQDESANCEKYISLLAESIESEHDGTSRTGLMLSGGFDSSLLAAILAGNDTWKRSLTCYSYLFDQHQSCDESQFIWETVDKLKLESSQVNGDVHYVFSDLTGRGIVKDMVNLDGYAALPEAIFKLAARDSKSMMIMGHFGDDLFGGNRYKFADLLLTGDFRSVLDMIFRSGRTTDTLMEFINFGIRPLLPMPVKKLYRSIAKSSVDANLFAISDSKVNNIDERLKQLNTRLFQRQNLLKLIYFSNTAEGIYYYRKHLYLGYGLKCLMPFYSKAMIEFFWNLPVCQLNKPNKYRWLQRQSLEMVGLTNIANRTTKTGFQELYSTGINQKRTQIAEIIKKAELNQEVRFPASLLEKLESNAAIETTEAVAINQYLLTAMWWQAISDSGDSYNQIVRMEIGSDRLYFKKKNIWNVNRR